MFCGLARPIDGPSSNSITLGAQTLEVVDPFCYLGDTINAGRGCTRGTIIRTRAAWGTVREL